MKLISKEISLLVMLLTHGMGVKSTTSSTYKLTITDECPKMNPINEMVLDSKVKCSMLCLTIMDCKGICYSKETSQCRTYGAMTSMITTPATGFKMYLDVSEPIVYKEYAPEATQIGWFLAQASCVLSGKTLAAPLSAEEEEEFINLATSSGGSGYFWIGFNDEAVEKEFIVPATGVEMTYVKWDTSTGQPNGMRDQNCMVIHVNNELWEDKPCDETYPFICEKAETF